MNKNLWLTITITLWASFLLVSVLTVYVNYGLPHGPYYPTDENTCDNEGENGTPGGCKQIYKEDLNNLNIPEWAKFLRRSEGILPLMGLLFLSILITCYDKSKISGYYKLKASCPYCGNFGVLYGEPTTEHKGVIKSLDITKKYWIMQCDTCGKKFYQNLDTGRFTKVKK